jgi:hypothetical protein
MNVLDRRDDVGLYTTTDRGVVVTLTEFGARSRMRKVKLKALASGSGHGRITYQNDQFSDLISKSTGFALTLDWLEYRLLSGTYLDHTIPLISRVSILDSDGYDIVEIA